MSAKGRTQAAARARVNTGTIRRSGARPSPQDAGGACTLALDQSEFPGLVGRLGLPAPSSFSPLRDLCAPGAKGAPRDPEAILAGLGLLSAEAAAVALDPLVAPDRVIDARATVFNGAPSPCRLFSSRRAPATFVGLRPGMEHDWELLFPFTPEDLEIWVRLQLQFSSGQHLPMPGHTFSAGRLGFLLALVDAYKTAFARSFAHRRAEPASISLTVADVLEAQNDAFLVRDRRWIATAVGEILSVMVHPGGGTGVRLPLVTEEAAREEVRRLAAEGFLEIVRDGRDLSFTLGVTLAQFAGSLFTWISITSLHDLQITGMQAGVPGAQEEAILFVATEPTVWTIATQGLTRAGTDLSGVTFVLRSLDVPTACDVAREILKPLPDVILPDGAYAPADAPGPTAHPAAEPIAPPPAPPAAPAAWTPTHRLPAAGLSCWDAPDPNRPPVTHADGGLDVQVVEERGAWARAIFSNGWSGWVDGRLLERR